MPKACGCYCKRHDPNELSSSVKALERLNAHGWFTTKQVAERLGMSIPTVILLADSGAFPGVRRTRGGHRRLHHAAIAAMSQVTLDKYLALTGNVVRGLPPRGIAA